MRQPYYANTLIDVVLPAQTVSTPAEKRGPVVLFPLPRPEGSGRLSSDNVLLDTGTWFVHDVVASTLPAQCPSQRAARVLADTWAGNVANAAVNPEDAMQVTNWCRWFVETHPDCAVLAPFTPAPAAAAMAMTEPPWPAGTDEDAAVSLQGKVAAALDLVAAGEASPEVGQADNEVTEEAS